MIIKNNFYLLLHNVGSKGLAHKKNGNTTQKIFSIVLV